MYCSKCNQDDCIWKVSEDEVIECTEVEVACDMAYRFNSDERKHQIKRKRAYRIFTVLNYGYLGKGNRKNLPGCVKLGIRAHYPSDTGSYMGHKDE